MPTYCFMNTDTGETQEFIWTIAQMESKTKGHTFKDEEGVLWERDFATEQGVGSSYSGNWPMKSDACGVHPNDAVKASKSAAKMGVPTSFDSNTGQAIFQSRSHRAQYMKARGFHDRNGGYGDG